MFPDKFLQNRINLINNAIMQLSWMFCAICLTTPKIAYNFGYK